MAGRLTIRKYTRGYQLSGKRAWSYEVWWQDGMCSSPATAVRYRFKCYSDARTFLERLELQMRGPQALEGLKYSVAPIDPEEGRW